MTDKRIPLIQYIKLLRGSVSESNNFEFRSVLRSLAIHLRHFGHDPTYKRARSIWLECYDYGLPVPREVEIIFLHQVRIYAHDWKWKPAAKAQPGLIFLAEEAGRLKKHEEEIEQIKAKRKRKGLKHGLGDVRDEIAARMNENAGDGVVTSDSIRKEFERVRKKLSDNGMV